MRTARGNRSEAIPPGQLRRSRAALHPVRGGPGRMTRTSRAGMLERTQQALGGRGTEAA